MFEWRILRKRYISFCFLLWYAVEGTDTWCYRSLIFYFTGRFRRIRNIHVSQYVSVMLPVIPLVSRTRLVVHGSISMNWHPARKPKSWMFFVGRLMWASEDRDNWKKKEKWKRVKYLALNSVELLIGTNRRSERERECACVWERKKRAIDTFTIKSY